MSITKTPASMIDPSGATNGQVLTFNGSTSVWVASAAPSPDPNSFYTTVGNASAGIFASAVCFIPSDPGTSTWTAPAGCYTARVTIVGGGQGSVIESGRSHFNYPTGSTTGANQLFADGGRGTGGSAGWNGINNLAIGGISSSVGSGGGGGGGCGGGGYGGGGGGYSANTYGGSYGGSGGHSPNNFEKGGGGSGGIGGDGQNGETVGTAGGAGGGSPTLSYAATLLPNFSSAIAQNPGRGRVVGGGSGAGWCSAIVSVTPGQSYSYAVGVAGVGASYGMVVIEW